MANTVPPKQNRSSPKMGKAKQVAPGYPAAPKPYKEPKLSSAEANQRRNKAENARIERDIRRVAGATPVKFKR